MSQPSSPQDRHLIELVTGEIDAGQLLRFVTSPASGAVILFLGTVREWTNGEQTAALEYEAYPEMALAVLREIVSETEVRWPIQKIALQHRLGRVELTETSVGVAVAAPHRQDAYAASRYLIDELKKRVPIWKKELWADGGSDWVHPCPVE